MNGVLCSDPSCSDELCDVIVGEPTPIRFGLHDVQGARAVMDRTGFSLPFTRSAFADVLEAFGEQIEDYAARLPRVSVDELEAARTRWQNERYRGVLGNSVRQEALTLILAAGLTMEAAARYLDETMDTLVAHLSSGEVDPDRTARYVTAERLLREGDRPYAHVAREVGLNDKTVKRLAELIGRGTGVRRGGTHLPPALGERVLELWRSGWPIATIHRAMVEQFPDYHVTYATVHGYTRRARQAEVA